MGLLQNNNVRALAFLFSLGLVAGAIQGCDKGLAEKLENKKDERFDDAARKLQIVAAQRHNASMASKLLFRMAENPLVRKALSANRNPVDRVHTVLEALRATFIDKDGKFIKGAEDLWGKYPALGRLENSAKSARALSEANALSYAVEQITSADSLETIKTSRKNLKFSDEYKGPDYRSHWVSKVTRLRNEAIAKCVLSCVEAAECKKLDDWRLCNTCAACYEGGGDTVSTIKATFSKSVGEPPYRLDSKTGAPLKKEGKNQTEFLARKDVLRRFDAKKRAAYKKDSDEVRYYDKSNGTGCYAGTLKNSQGESCRNVEQNKAICAGNATEVYPIILAPSDSLIASCLKRAKENRDSGLVELYSAGNPSNEAFGKLELVDPWGQDYTYAFPSKRSKDEMAFDICSAGPDKTAGNDDDICHRGKAEPALDAHRKSIRDTNLALRKTAVSESKLSKGGKSVAVIQEILDNNLMLGAMVGVSAVAEGTGHLVAWRFFTGSWDSTVAYDAIKNEYRGTPTQKMAIKARAFDRESAEFWKQASANNLRKMSGVLERYTLFIDSYLADAAKDPKDACVRACGQIFKDFEEEQAKEVQVCRITCITQEGKDAVNACEVKREERTKACPEVEGNADEVAEAKECLRVANTKGDRCAKMAFDNSMPSQDAISNKDSNKHYVPRPFLNEAAFDKVFLQMAANDNFFAQRWAREDKKLGRKKDFYALAFDFPTKGNESDRGYFGRACQESRALRDLCRSTPDELREDLALAPYYYRSYVQARDFLSNYAKLAEGASEANVKKVAASVLKQMGQKDPAALKAYRESHPECSARASALDKERCARDDYQLFAKTKMSDLRAARKADTTKFKGFKASLAKCGADRKDAMAKKNAKKPTVDAAHATCIATTISAIQALVDDKKEADSTKLLTALVGKYRGDHAARIAKAFEPAYEAKDPEAADFVATISTYRSVLGQQLATIAEVVEDPALPSSLSPYGGGGFGLTLGFSEQAGGIFLGIGGNTGSRGEKWTQIHKGFDLKSVDKKLAETIVSTYNTLAKDAGKRDPRRMQVKVPGNFNSGVLAQLLASLPAQSPNDSDSEEEEGEAKTVVEKLTLLGRRRVDDSMKRTQIIMARPSATKREMNSYYEYQAAGAAANVKKQCTYVGVSGTNIGRPKGQPEGFVGHVIVFEDNKLQTGSVVDCEWGYDAATKTCKGKPCPKDFVRNLASKKCEAGPKYKAKIDKETGKLIPPEEPEATWERTFSKLTPLGTGTLDKGHLDGSSETSWARQRSLEATRKKTDFGSDYANLSKWLDDKKNAGTVRLFVPDTLKYEEMTTLLSAVLFSCKDREFEVLSEQNGKVRKDTYFLGCGEAGDRNHQVHLSVCSSGSDAAATAAP